MRSTGKPSSRDNGLIPGLNDLRSAVENDALLRSNRFNLQ